MHEQAMKGDQLVYDASQYKHSWSDDTDSCTFLRDMIKFLSQIPTAFSSDQFDILHLQVLSHDARIRDRDNKQQFNESKWNEHSKQPIRCWQQRWKIKW
ncbi:hypothetical protein scyTo_0000129 [Scyliorhinus torazame]|uniref:Uncharacterized protein n=1 Tax=Scyliorhinus torazame TaxID=75743 RepID=A0A401NQX5_SCYTO|nr:hypothetical protein [Scyliorhinus torazame]